MRSIAFDAKQLTIASITNRRKTGDAPAANQSGRTKRGRSVGVLLLFEKGIDRNDQSVPFVPLGHGGGLPIALNSPSGCMFDVFVFS